MRKKFLCLFVAMLLFATVFSVPGIQAGAAAVKYAEPATDEELAQSSLMVQNGGISFEIIDGDLWVWGSNRNYTIGLTKTTNPSTGLEEAVELNKVYSWATKIAPEKFGGQKIKAVYAYFARTYAVTENNVLYGWGSNLNNQVSLTDNSGNILEPAAILLPDGSNPFAGKTILKVLNDDSTSTMVKTVDSAGKLSWFAWGSNNMGESIDQDTIGNAIIKTPIEIPATYLIEKGFSDSEIIDVAKAERTVALLTKNGDVYTMGDASIGRLGDNYGMAYELTEGDEGATPNKNARTTPKKIDFGPLYNGKGKKIVAVYDAYRNFAALDSDGCVWTWGDTRRGGVGNGQIDSIHYPKPYLALGANSENSNTNTKKARKVFPAVDGFTVLCTDNTVFGWGQNYNGSFYSGSDWQLIYARPIQCFTEASRESTITNIYFDHAGYKVKTRTATDFIYGENSSGMAGNGTTDTTTQPGESTSTENVTLPPVVPSTKNKIYMDIEFNDSTNQGKLNTVSGEAGATGESITANVYAGQKFTLKVYFEDFGKLDQFTLPIRFTSSRASVVYKSGSSDAEYKAYGGDENEALDGSNVVKFSPSTGVHSHITQAGWAGGALTENSAYPRINNEKGYISVHGATTTQNAPLVGKQLMFSIDFIANGSVQDGPVTFSIMNAEETQASGDPLLAGDSKGATWTFLRDLPVGTTQEYKANIEFDKDECAKYIPKVMVETVSLQKIDLKLQFKKDGFLYDSQDTVTVTNPADNTTQKYYIIDKQNTDVNYTVQSIATPTNATNQDVTWSVAWDDFAGVTNPGDKQISDYIEIVQQGTRSLTFQMPVSSTTTQDGYFVLTATKDAMKINPIRIKVASMVPPAGVEITNKGDCPNPFRSNDEGSIFTFRALVDDRENTKNTNVTWTLYNCVDNEDGTTTETIISKDDLTAPAVIREVGQVVENGVTFQTAMVHAQRTTPDGSYVKVKVASTASDAVNDSTTLRVELLSTGFSTDSVVYLGKGTSKQLTISSDPFDAYGPEYDISVALDSPAATNQNRTYIVADKNKRMITAVNECYDGDPITDGVYDEVIIKETKAYDYYMEKGETDKANAVVKRIRVYVMAVNPPANMDVVAENNIGTINDRVVFNADLREHDTVKIYKSFMDESSLAETLTDITKSDITILRETGYVFDGGLDGNGGTIGYLVERSDGNTYTQVPVNYSSEPCRLFGYARLEGKLDNSGLNGDIVVEVTGLRDANGNAVPAKQVLDNTGYFEFENYVPVGEYTIKVSRDLYITRYLTLKVTGTSDVSDIEVSTSDLPIYLAPGDLGNPKNNKVDPAEYNSYLTSWFGKKKSRASVRFDDYNFYEGSVGDSVIGMDDLSLILRYYNRANVYQNWTVSH